MTLGTEVGSKIGVVAADPPMAAEIGAAVLRAGGNAMDAASAASMACCMLDPLNVGVGGYVCTALVKDGKTGKVWCVDANAVAPAGAHAGMYDVTPLRSGEAWTEGTLWVNEGEYQCHVKDNANVLGPKAVAAPGMMAGMGIVHERWGRLPWADIVAPSQKLIADGFLYGRAADGISRHAGRLQQFSETTKHLMPGGKLPKENDIWHAPGLETTLARIAAAGWRDFYDGELGRRIGDAVRDAGGVLTREDMAAYEPRVVEPHGCTYRDANIYASILPNGGLSVLQAMNMLECIDPAVLLDEGQPAYWHLLAEVLKRVWRDRLNYLNDPAFTAVPVDRLLSKDYAAGRVESIAKFPTYVDKRVPSPQPVGPGGTLHLSTADADGNLVSITISQGMPFGSMFTPAGTGVILGHGMCRLDPRPGLANSIEPGKRPLNNTCCLMVESPERDIAIGVPGGRRIISMMTQAAVRLIDGGRSVADVAAEPRMHIEVRDHLELRNDVPKAVADSVRDMGHEVNVIDRLGGCMNGAERSTGDGALRGGSGISAAGA